MKKGWLKIVLILVVFIILYLLTWTIDFSNHKKPDWGITFSQFYAQKELGLNWQESYLAILDELNPKNLRLIAYWNDIEPEKGKFNFIDLDWQIKEAEKRNKQIILVVGQRVPRWPECHHPDWTKNLTEEEINNVLSTYLKEIINHYKSSSIIAWQVENEPLFYLFGDCPRPDKKFLKKEVELVKSLDPTRPIIITDSGEISTWLETAGISEILGTTLYRIVWSKYLGWVKHPYSPMIYTLRAFVVKNFSKTKEVIISELQVEPWAERKQSIVKIPFDEQVKHFSTKDLKNNFKFAQKTGINKIYLWGVEWWYWRKTKGDESYWKTGKEIFSQ